MNRFDPETIAAMRTALDEVCSHMPVDSISARTFVASRILECAGSGVTTLDDLKTAGKRAVLDRFTDTDAAGSMSR
jgi:hypothetical protein